MDSFVYLRVHLVGRIGLMDIIPELRALYPQMEVDELHAVSEALRRYVETSAQTAARVTVLTEAAHRGNLKYGAVDPGTFKTTFG
jgi:hypothetical protein